MVMRAADFEGKNTVVIFGVVERFHATNEFLKNDDIRERFWRFIGAFGESEV
jgi:hypothetical protein